MGTYVSPSGTDIRRMIAKAQEMELSERDYEYDDTVRRESAASAGKHAYAAGVRAALAWVLGERKEPPIADAPTPKEVERILDDAEAQRAFDVDEATRKR